MFVKSVCTTVVGFGECQSAYNPYPNALLCLRYINEVGKMIIGDFSVDAGEIKEGDNVQPPPDVGRNTEEEVSKDNSSHITTN